VDSVPVREWNADGYFSEPVHVASFASPPLGAMNGSNKKSKSSHRSSADYSMDVFSVSNFDLGDTSWTIDPDGQISKSGKPKPNPSKKQQKAVSAACTLHSAAPLRLIAPAALIWPPLLCGTHRRKPKPKPKHRRLLRAKAISAKPRPPRRQRLPAAPNPPNRRAVRIRGTAQLKAAKHRSSGLTFAMLLHRRRSRSPHSCLTRLPFRCTQTLRLFLSSD
jgi:hypothetical protein